MQVNYIFKCICRTLKIRPKDQILKLLFPSEDFDFSFEEYNSHKHILEIIMIDSSAKEIIILRIKNGNKVVSKIKYDI